MLQAITWKEYLAAIVVIAAIWYAVVGFLYYRKEAKALLKNGPKLPGRKHAPDQADAIEETFNEDPDAAFGELEATVEDIRHSILEVAGKAVTKDALLRQLQTRLTNYDGLHLPAFRLALTNFIIKHAEALCGVSFSEDELNAAWEEIAH